jgi:hypothetical protein
MSPTARTRKYLEALGYVVDVVERWIPGRGGKSFGVRKDLWGFVDLLAMKSGHPILAIQTTSGSHVADRIKKIRGIPHYKTWLECGCRIQVIGWRKVCRRRADGSRTKQKYWEPIIHEVEDA